MNQVELDAAIEQANRIFSRRYRTSVEPGGGSEEPAVRQEQPNWLPGFLDAERRFGQPYAKLFACIGRKVRSPAGPGTLLQVFADRCTVVLDSQLSQCARFAPGEIEPVSWQAP